MSTKQNKMPDNNKMRFFLTPRDTYTCLLLATYSCENGVVF